MASLTTTETQTMLDPMGPLDKLQTANMARLMGDNQRVLDIVNRRAEAFAQWEANKVLGEEMPEAAEDMQISIDSPVTTSHHYPVQQSQPASTAGKVIAGAAIAASLIGIPGAGVIGYLASQLANSTQPAPIVQDENLDVGLGTIDELVLDKEK